VPLLSLELAVQRRVGRCAKARPLGPAHLLERV